MEEYLRTLQDQEELSADEQSYVQRKRSLPIWRGGGWAYMEREGGCAYGEGDGVPIWRGGGCAYMERGRVCLYGEGEGVLIWRGEGVPI